MGLASEMKNLSSEILSSFKQRIQENDELVNDVQKTLEGFRKDHQEMAAIINSNALSLRKGLALGEKDRLNTYNDLMSGIHKSIMGIRNEVNEIQKASNGMISNLSDDRSLATAEWNNMQNAIANIRRNGISTPPRPAEKIAEIKEIKQAPAIEVVKEIAFKDELFSILPEEPKTMEEKVLDYITKHPGGVKISDMEEPFGETRMKLGFTAKTLLDEGKIQKIDKVYFPFK